MIVALSKLTTTAGDAATGFLAASAVAVSLVIVGIVVTVRRHVRMNLKHSQALNLKIESIDDDGPTIGDLIREASAERLRRSQRISRFGLCAIVASLFTIVLSHWLYAGRNFKWIVVSLDAFSLLLFALGLTVMLAGPWWVYSRNRAA